MAYQHRLGADPYPFYSFLRGFVTKEVAFFHKDSKSLIEADLLFNMPPNEQVQSPVNPLAVIRLYTAEIVLEIQEGNLLDSYQQSSQPMVVRA